MEGLLNYKLKLKRDLTTICKTEMYLPMPEVLDKANENKMEDEDYSWLEFNPRLPKNPHKILV